MSPGFVYEDLARGGIYTKAELTSWQEQISYGDLHEVIVKTLTMGMCVGDGSCRAAPSSPAYHLQNLLDPSKIMETIDPIENLKGMVVDNAVWISLLVLLIEGLKFIAFISSIFTTLLQEGIQGLLAILYILFCGPRIASKRVICKGRALCKLPEDVPLCPMERAPTSESNM